MFSYVKPEQKQTTKSTVQKKEPEKPAVVPNRTGIPDTMKTRFENLSGFPFDDVRVHYNSDKPAQLQALAYTQGNQVYIAPGQEKHLAHELGHVVQQKQQDVPETTKIRGYSVNNDSTLEKAADELTAHPKAFMSIDQTLNKSWNDVVQLAEGDVHDAVVERKGGGDLKIKVELTKHPYALWFDIPSGTTLSEGDELTFKEGPSKSVTNITVTKKAASSVPEAKPDLSHLIDLSSVGIAIIGDSHKRHGMTEQEVIDIVRKGPLVFSPSSGCYHVLCGDGITTQFGKNGQVLCNYDSSKNELVVFHAHKSGSMG